MLRSFLLNGLLFNGLMLAPDGGQVDGNDATIGQQNQGDTPEGDSGDGGQGESAEPVASNAADDEVNNPNATDGTSTGNPGRDTLTIDDLDKKPDDLPGSAGDDLTEDDENQPVGEQLEQPAAPPSEDTPPA
jgi:hypothetical protein